MLEAAISNAWFPISLVTCAGRIVAMVATRLLLIAVLMLWAAPVRAESIRIAYSGVAASGTPVWLAKEEGLFAKHGLEADLVAVRSAPIQVTALVSNEVQFVRGSASSMLTAAAQGAKLKIIMSLFAERASYDFLVGAVDHQTQRFARQENRRAGLQRSALESHHAVAARNGSRPAKGQHQHPSDRRQHRDRPVIGIWHHRRRRVG